MKSSLKQSLGNPSKTRKTVRISSKIQKKKISPDARLNNQHFNFSKEERKETIKTIHDDPDFKEYLAERRKGIPVKEYRSNVLNTVKNYDKLLREIRHFKTRKARKTPSPTSSKQKEEDKITVSRTKQDSKKRIQPQLLSSIAPSTPSTHSSVKEKEKEKEKSLFSSIPSLFTPFRQKTHKTSKK